MSIEEITGVDDAKTWLHEQPMVFQSYLEQVFVELLSKIEA